MSIARTHARINALIAEYELFLANIPETNFQCNPPQGGWSYSEVYSHIFESNLLSLLALEKCVKGLAEETKQRNHWAVRLILFFGKFPPGKIKAPARIADLVKKISKEEALQLMAKLKQRLTALVPSIAQASATQKAKHPRLGPLNAKQWLRFVEIHTEHHWAQLQRIQKHTH